jgi:hypothetical protein
VICCFGCEFKQLIAKMQVFLRKKEEKRVERDRDRERVYRPKKSLQIYSL